MTKIKQSIFSPFTGTGFASTQGTMVEIEPTELVLLVAKRRRQGRRTLGRMASPPANAHNAFVKGICFALLIANTLLYVVTFGPIGALGWGAVAYIVSRAPVD